EIFGRKVLNQLERMPPSRILLVIFLTQSGLVQGKLKVTLRNSFAFRAVATEHEYFTCHISETDKTDLSVTSRRVVNTRNYPNNNPPPNNPSYVSDGVYKIDLSRVYNGAFGVFACDISRSGRELTSIQTILLRSDANIIPNDRLLTRTVNNGDEGIVLRMDELTRYNTVYWRKDGGASFNYGSLTLSVPQSRGRIRLSDAGIYECYHNTWRNYAVQGLQRIIVRACPADHWGPPDCFGICENCYNGGVCDDTTGGCICPVGFKGPNCLSACDPSGRFGFNCDFQCTEDEEFNSACRDYMFCLPDPFGCRCASGFKGLDCRTVPEQCKQVTMDECLVKCHCKNDAACNKITGRCNNNQCAQGFFQQDPNGNCQECTTGFYGENCEQECHCNEACHNVNGTCSGPCKTPWVNWNPRCQTGIADIRVSKVNPGATAEINCTVESPNSLASVAAILSVTGANQGRSFIGVRIELSSQSIVQSFKVSNVMSGDVFSCYLANRDNSLVNSGRHYRRKEADLYVLPLIARSPELISASNTTITISWTAWNDNSDVGDPPVIGYVPYYRTNEEEGWIFTDSVQANGMPTLSFTFSDLKPDTLYQFSAAAVREGPFGEGPKSSFESARTYCPIPTLAPLNVQAAIVEMGSTNVNISWKVPDIQCNTGIKQFLLYFNDLETPNMVEKSDEDSLLFFINHINSFHSTIKFTSDYSHQQVNFLDVTVPKEHSFLSTDLYTKPTDTHQYLHSSSCHPRHCKSGIAYSQALRLCRIWSNNSSFIRRTDALEKHLTARGHSARRVREAIQRVRFLSRSSTLAVKDKKGRDCDNKLPNNILLTSDKLQRAVPEKPIIAYRRPRNIQDLLVCAAVQLVTSIQHASMLSNVIVLRDASSAATTLWNPIPATACNSHTRLRVTSLALTTNVIYLISCRVCGIQYVGETKTTLKKQFYGHKSTVNTMKTETPVGEHFNLPNHTINDMSL
ncbi:putative tyrosine-protein kinase, partial [Apostichopus japonicus]